jgi:hypothetical protein
MEAFDRAIAFLKSQDLGDAHYEFLAIVISSSIWSKECNNHLMAAAQEYMKDSELYSNEACMG